MLWIYLLNLTVTVAMFMVLVFRAWIEGGHDLYEILCHMFGVDDAEN